MSMDKTLISRYSMGTGDRFAHQGKAQLQAMIEAKSHGVDITPVWNKSHREHTTIHTQPIETRKEADEAVKALGWKGAYFVDADHVGLKTVDLFLDACDFFTLDVADFIGEKCAASAIDAFTQKYAKYAGALSIPGIEAPVRVSLEQIHAIAEKYLFAVQAAGKIYRHILENKTAGSFVPEVSMDETDSPQTPVEMLFILAAIAEEGIPAQTIAPKFTGRFNKGVNYVGDVAQFTREFEEDLAVIQFAVREFGLPENLKLSVHSGSDKFAIYAPIRKAIRKFDAGLHLKTAGTTWLEELIGLAEAGGDGLEIAKLVYVQAYARYDELAKPYATVIDIDQTKLPKPADVKNWSSEKYATSLRHDSNHPNYDQNFRQLLHVGYKVAAEMGNVYLNALKKHEATIAKHVKENILERHIKPLFID